MAQPRTIDKLSYPPPPGIKKDLLGGNHCIISCVDRDVNFRKKRVKKITVTEWHPQSFFRTSK